MTKLIHLIFCALLGYTAWLQLNDPDPLFWVTLYLLAAAVPFVRMLSLGGGIGSKTTGVAAGYCAAGILMTLPGGVEYLNHMTSESLIQGMSPTKPYIEEARELIGTVFAFIVVVAYWVVDSLKLQRRSDYFA